LARHEKWIVEASAMGLRDFADRYRFGVSGPAPAVHYTGGSISFQAHQERFHSEPVPIVTEFTRAWERAGRPTVDLIVSSAPPLGEAPRPEPLESYLEYVCDQLLPKLGAAPTALGFLGYSLGGSFATYLAALNEEARALAVFGGAGFVEAAREARTVMARDLSTALFRNEDDPLHDPRVACQQLPVGLHARAMGLRAGGHPFGDYASNGTVSDAFAFVLERVR
jgi:pimeloyl-ACP methyl ester carboxylesterase